MLVLGRSCQPWVLTSRGSGTYTDPQLKHRGGTPWTAAKPRRVFGLHLHVEQTMLRWWQRPGHEAYQQEYALLICACGQVRVCIGTSMSSWRTPDSASAALLDRAVAREPVLETAP